MNKYSIPKGTADIYGEDVLIWQYLESKMREVAKQYGYGEIRTPMFENTELFLRGVGDTTDIVQKEMYTFEDKGGRSLTLKPEGTAGAVRSFVENGMHMDAQPIKLYYITPAFRYEKPQAGRYRQLHQFGIEAFGAEDATMDAEVISVAYTLLERLGVKNITLKINSIGCKDCRPIFNKALSDYFKSNEDKLCLDCRSRLDKNPLRILDCKEESCKEVIKDAPRTLDYLDDECEKHFEDLKKYVEAIGIKYEIDTNLVRGLDYYTRTVFEFISSDLGAQSTVCGGGRYDGLVETLGGKPTPGVGFGMGIERLTMTVKAMGTLNIEDSKDIYIGAIGENALAESFKIVNDLRKAGFRAELDHIGRSVKAQMKYANKKNFKYVVILGDDEIEAGKVKMKNMTNSEEIEVAIDEIINNIK
ncbi:MAG: histidine--tRNA ligase [Clostridia bacterium]|jgi:histidyl-tRNA synthetase|nr:histidine--tRNA ligase [Clostridia bacterium]